MNRSTNSNVIIGSKLALAMCRVIKSPVREPVMTAPDRTRLLLQKMDRRCASLKNRSLKLLDGMKAEDTRIAYVAATMRNPVEREATKRMGRTVGKLMDQQTALHSKLEKLLDVLMLQIVSDKGSNS